MTEVKVVPVNVQPASTTPGIHKGNYNQISMAQAKLKVSKRFKTIVANSVLLIVAVDILGTAIVMPALPSLCAWADGGPAETLIDDAKKSANYDSMTTEMKAAFDTQLGSVV